MNDRTDAAYVTEFAREVPSDAQPQRVTFELSDGYETYGYRYAVGEPSRFPVLYVHGIQSHPGWYSGSAAALARAGHEVFVVARRGSGENATARGHAASASQLLEDVDRVAWDILRRTGQPRLHLVGVSWGGKLLTGYAGHSKRTCPVASLTLAAPGLAARVDVSLREKLAILLALLISPNRRFDIPLNRPELFTSNPRMLDYLERDSLRLHRATARLMYASRQLDGLIRSMGRGRLTVPTTLLLASRDRIIDNARTLKRVRRLTADRATVRVCVGAHTLEFEPHPRFVFDLLRDALAEAERTPLD